VKLANIRITYKLVVLVAVTMIGLCAAGILAAYMVKSEMQPTARRF
jgi:methyl-accepting chemotaxis protein